MQHCKALDNYVVIRRSCSPLTAHSSRLCYAPCEPHPLLSFLRFILFYLFSFCALAPSPRPITSAGFPLQGRGGSYLNDLSWLFGFMQRKTSAVIRGALPSPAPRAPGVRLSFRDSEASGKSHHVSYQGLASHLRHLCFLTSLQEDLSCFFF